MSDRPEGFGFSAEVKAKLSSKYDDGLESDVRAWINKKVPGAFSSNESAREDFYQTLKSGVVLCKLINALQPGSVKKVNDSKMAFKMMENIGNFLTACESYGVPKTDLFQTVDLFENQNMPQVINGLLALSRKSGKKGDKDATGPKEATESKREFTQEQLKEGQSVIGLQMGTNKGASQAGISFGAQRQIH